MANNINQINQNKFYKIYLVGFFLILVLPLITAAPLMHPPAWGKTIIFRIIFSVLIFIFIYQIILRKHGYNILPQKGSKLFWPFWLLISFWALNLLATIFSLDPYVSLWDSPYRAGGFVNYTFYALFAILMFLILKAKDWQKILDFTLFIGVIVAVMGIIQKFRLLSDYFLSYDYRPVSTMGGPMFLATYLLLLTFLAFSLGLSVKSKKKYLYFIATFLFLFVIALTATRSAFLGIVIGGLFFVFFFPGISKKTRNIKIAFALILVLAVFGVFWLKNSPQITEKLKENSVLGPFFERIWTSIGEFSIAGVLESRGDGWKIGLKGIKDRPILGYGPENFSIAFDRYYDSSLKGVQRGPGGSGSSTWWDRAHNFMIDISANAGIPALVIYLLFFSVLFYQLQKTKRTEDRKARITSHGLQATFLGYFISLFFSFDIFSTFLISFLLISYSFFLIRGNDKKTLEIKEKNNNPTIWKYILISFLFIALIIFIWKYNIWPLVINKDVNIALISANADPKFCDQSINLMESLMPKQSIVDNNLRLQYVDLISECIRQNPQRYKLALSYRAVEILEEAMEIRPSYTRTWQFAGIYITKFIEASQELNIEDAKQQLVTMEIPYLKKAVQIQEDQKLKIELAKKSYYYFEKALELSPNRQQTFNHIARLDLIFNKFEEVIRKSDQCIEKSPGFGGLGDCWWIKAIAQINLGQIEKGLESIKIAKEKGYLVNEKNAVGELINLFSKTAKKTSDVEYYSQLIVLYEKIIELEPDNFQHHASLAFVYKTLGQYDKAREQALIVLKLSPESKVNVEAFINSLPK